MGHLLADPCTTLSKIIHTPCMRSKLATSSGRYSHCSIAIRSNGCNQLESAGLLSDCAAPVLANVGCNGHGTLFLCESHWNSPSCLSLYAAHLGWLPPMLRSGSEQVATGNSRSLLLVRQLSSEARNDAWLHSLPMLSNILFL